MNQRADRAPGLHPYCEIVHTFMHSLIVLKGGTRASDVERFPFMGGPTIWQSGA